MSELYGVGGRRECIIRCRVTQQPLPRRATSKYCSFSWLASTWTQYVVRFWWICAWKINHRRVMRCTFCTCTRKVGTVVVLLGVFHARTPSRRTTRGYECTSTQERRTRLHTAPIPPTVPEHNTLNLSSHRFNPPTKHESTKKTKLHIIKTSLALQITQTEETNATLATCQPEHNLCVMCVSTWFPNGSI